MSSTTYKSINKKDEANEEVVLQITKKQLVNFIRFSVLAMVLVINLFAIALDSPLLFELITIQIVIGLVLLTRDLNTHSTLK